MGDRNELEDNCSEHEAIPLRDIDKEDTDEESHSKSVHRNDQLSFLTELRHNRDTRFKVILSVFVAFADSMLGWRKGQVGPAFLDILYITGTDLEKGSTFMTSYSTGLAIGSMIGGSLYSKVNRYLILVVAMSINSIALVLIPWCAMYELMITAHAIQGLSNGVIVVVRTAIAVSIWGATARGRVYLNIFLATSCLAGLLSPMVTSPFLLPSSGDADLRTGPWNSSDNNINTTDTFTTEGTISTTNAIPKPNITHTALPASKVFIAYSISAGLVLLSTLPFVVIYFKTSKNVLQSSVNEESQFIGNLPLSFKRLQLVNIGVFSTFYMSLNFIFSGYLAAFCVQHLRWTKASGAWLTSELFLAMLCGRIFGAYLSQFFKPLKMLVLSTLLHAMGLVGLSVSGVVLADVGIWISVGVVGIALSLMLPSLLSWTNESLIAVRGKVTAFLMLMGYAGALSSPLLFGYMMEEVSPIWFCFLNLGKAGITIINVMLMFLYARLLRKSNKQQNNEHIDS